MTHGNPHDEAEHASHHAQDPFDKRVAMSMVVIAALLAMVKVLGHRTHNDTLAFQIEAGVHHTQQSDQWNFFQAKRYARVASPGGQERPHVRRPGQGRPCAKAGPMPGRDRRLGEFDAKISPTRRWRNPRRRPRPSSARADKRYGELLGKRYSPDVAERVAEAEAAAERDRTESQALLPRRRRKRMRERR